MDCVLYFSLYCVLLCKNDTLCVQFDAKVKNLRAVYWGGAKYNSEKTHLIFLQIVVCSSSSWREWLPSQNWSIGSFSWDEDFWLSPQMKPSKKWPRIIFWDYHQQIPMLGKAMVRGITMHFDALLGHFDKIIWPHPGPLWAVSKV